MEVGNRQVKLSRFVTVFDRRGVTALYNSIKGKTLYLSGPTLRAVSPLLKKSTSLERFIADAKVSHKDINAVVLALNDLLENSFLCPADNDERGVINKLRARFEEPTGFENLTVYLTTGCNLNCKYCQLHSQPGKSNKKILSMKSFKQGINAFFSSYYSPDGVPRRVQFFGGEPLIEWPSFVKMVEYIRFCEEAEKFGGEKVDIHVNTNGTLLTDEILSFLKKNNVYLSVSLDGPQKEHDLYRKDLAGKGTYQKIIHNMQRAHEIGIDVTVLSVLGAHNLSGLPKFIKKIHDTCSVSFFGLNPIIGDDKWQKKFSVGKFREKLMKVIDQLLDIDGVAVNPFHEQWEEFANDESMLAGQECISGTRLVLFPTGHVAPCVQYVFRDNTPRLSRFKSLYPSEVWKEVRSSWSLYDPDCYNSCPLIGFCDGGCPINAQRAAKDGKRPMCNLSRSLLEAFIWRKHRMQKELV
ncbi:MAG: radical SAM protein [Pseudomonadota bacterium]